MVKHQYSCNLCQKSFEPNEVVGIYWTYCGEARRLALCYYPLHQTESHLCRLCMEDIYRMYARNCVKQSEEIEPGDTQRAMSVAAYMIRDAARKYVDSKLAKDSDEFDRLINLFNRPPEEMFALVMREAEAKSL